jgi:hypothetical protein
VFSPDSALILTASRDKTAKLWDAVSGKLIHAALKGQPTAEDLKRPEVISVLDAAVCRAASGELSGCRGMRSAPKKIFATIRVAKPPLSLGPAKLAWDILLCISCQVLFIRRYP